MKIKVGEVVSVRGTKVVLKIFEESNKDTLFYEGNKYKGVSIREYLTIQRGFVDIMCIVEGEYLDESKVDLEDDKLVHIRKVEVKPIGYYRDGRFDEGAKYLPMIKDPAFLVTEEDIKGIYSKNSDESFVIGEMLKEEIPISLPWQRLFNSHIGIFGNTGSGKSNTLAKLYTVLFNQKKDHIKGKSQFILLDFNGEYTNNQLLKRDEKDVYKLNTTTADSKFPITDNDFWDSEVLSILFKATESTQKPFLNRIVMGRKRFSQREDSLNNYLKTTFKRVFIATSQKRECIDLLKQIIKTLNDSHTQDILEKVSWHGRDSKFYIASGVFFNGGEEDVYNKTFNSAVSKLNCINLDYFEELTIRVNLQLINDLISSYVQFEYIQPLLKRIESSMNSLSKVIYFSERNEDAKLLTVISLRKCNQEIKKVLPLLISKHYYQYHKHGVGNPPNKTIHIIIDEAHNILSQQSTREQESWKDYRLELFEEIIKEGRKFGVFLTLSSQRPADISPTIMSQVHNFFIHRLVNDKDLFLLDNTISTLDAISRDMIPNLSTGSCVVTGTSFDLPLMLQVDQLGFDSRPDSEDVDLEKLWSEDNT